MRVILLSLVLSISYLVTAQPISVEFGQISREEIAMKSYDKDKEAKAVVLYDKGKSEFFHTDQGYQIRFTRHRKIKIFDKTETQHHEVSIPYYVDGYGRTEAVRYIKANTYNFTNEIMFYKQLDPSTVYKEKIDEHWSAVKFVFPDVQDGAILEYEYTIETPFHFNLPDWTFQSRIPTLYSEYQVSMIPFYSYVYIVQGISKFDYQHSEKGKELRSWGTVVKSYGSNVGSGIEFKDYIHTYVLKDIPAFKDESYISSIDDYIIKMDFQLARFNSPNGSSKEIISDWPTLNDRLLKHEKFGKFIRNSSRFAKKIIETELILTDLNKQLKAKKIINYVKQHFTWNQDYSKYASQTSKEFFDKKRGNSADINLFMIALLNEAGIKTEPVILSTRNHGKMIADYPFDHFTNYVIGLVHTNTIFLADATEENCAFNKLPLACYNDIGLIVNKNDPPGWVSLENKVASIEKNIIYLTLDSLTFDIDAQISIQTTEHQSLINRERFGNDKQSLKEYYSYKIGDVQRVTTTGYERKSLPYSINLKSVYKTEKIGNNIVIYPFLKLPFQKNDLNQEKRDYPVDIVFPRDYQFETTLIIPNGFKLVDISNKLKEEDDLMLMSLQHEIEENKIQLKGNYKMKKAVYSSDEYAQIKKSIDTIVQAFNEPLIVEKCSNCTLANSEAN